MSKTGCDHCGKVGDAPRHEDADGEYWGGLPAGWLTRQKTFWGEIESEHTVCSVECAKALVAAEHAERDAKAAEYARRKKAGELSGAEIMMERMRDEWVKTMARNMEAWRGMVIDRLK